MNIYQFSAETLFYWILAFSIYEWIAISIILTITNKKTPKEYYTVLPSWVAVFGDFIYSTAILLTAQLIFKILDIQSTEAKKIVFFIIVVIVVQWIFDLIFAYFVVSSSPTFSKYVSFFQRYIKEVGFIAAISDSIWITCWILLTILCLKYIPIDVGSVIITLSLFIWLVLKW